MTANEKAVEREALPLLPQSLLDLIGEYGHARTDGVSEFERIHRWGLLIAGIKDYAHSVLQECATKPPADRVALAEECKRLVRYVGQQVADQQAMPDDSWRKHVDACCSGIDRLAGSDAPPAARHANYQELHRQLRNGMERLHAAAVAKGYDGIAAAIEAAPKWIPVAERLPQKFEEVLIAFRDTPLPATGQYTASPHDTWGWCFPKENDPEYTGPITHWMPLPASPEVSTPPEESK